MTINNMLTLFLASGIGLGIGVFFFGGLWWTVRKSLLSKHPAIWFFSSLLLRMSVALFGFYLVITSQLFNSHWQPLLLCMLSFLMARIVITRLTRVSTPVYKATTSVQSVEEPHHAP